MQLLLSQVQVVAFFQTNHVLARLVQLCEGVSFRSKKCCQGYWLNFALSIKYCNFCGQFTLLMLQLNALPRILRRFVAMVGELDGGKTLRKTNTGGCERMTSELFRHGSFRKAEEVLRQYNVGKVEKDWDKKNQKQPKVSLLLKVVPSIYPKINISM